MNNELNLQLLHLLRASGNAIRRTKRNQYGLPPGYGRMMAVIYRCSGATQSELAEELGVRPQSLTKALTRLEQEGLIVRKKTEDNRRNTRVWITEAGTAVHRRMRAGRQARADRIFSGFSAEEKEALAGYLERIITACDEDSAV
ncbi:MAG: MarR family transcriptional regulator [Solobacterium sp.]|nr:MarR family transcriptional regulator [Solobacterium sp.]MBQ6531392.1 MarR family transcriptional regulator [Solobacterium sp.]MBR0213653.1 MarR family transcriptional regulator [Solobacterium sp.]MBR3128378.1 MarR family transcriptional regulator [Solobacterium sp.]